jgi:cycloartenol synthase
MWRLKIADGGGDPWLRTKNAHVGRQVWEFDPAADDPDALAAVEAARREFTAGRHRLKHSADRLMRIQVTECPPLSPLPPRSVPRRPLPAPHAKIRILG